MGTVLRQIVECKMDWPVEDTLISVEENFGDVDPIHIHFMSSTNRHNLFFRLHFGYDEFKQFAEAIIAGGKL
jgi:hypothetical protein